MPLKVNWSNRVIFEMNFFDKVGFLNPTGSTVFVHFQSIYFLIIEIFPFDSNHAYALDG